MAEKPPARQIIEELLLYGIKGHEVHRGKHSSVEWTVPGADPELGSRCLIVSLTPSDHRASLNNRSQLRRMMKADNIPLKPRQKPTTFKAAISSPEPVVRTEPERLAQLEADVNTLVDMTFELLERLQSATATVDISFPSPRDTETSEKAPAPAFFVEGKRVRFPGVRPYTFQEAVLAQFPTVGTCTVRELVGCLGKERTSISTALNLLKEKGLVERQSGNAWRLTEKALSVLMKTLETRQQNQA